MTSGPRLLLVEDNPADARLVHELLRECRGGFSVVHAGRLERALELASTEPVDVMLLDLTLPDSSGLDTVRRACASAPGLPIVVMTGMEDEEIALRAVAEGAQDYLVKGEIDAPLLQRSLAYAVERKAFERQLRHHALHDALTGLPNRMLLLERLEQATLRHHRRGTPFALLSISLDNHRTITAGYGHATSDRWINAVVARLHALLRPGDTLARVGPDHLVALCELDGPASLSLAERIQHELLRGEAVDGEELLTTASIGITTSDTRHERAEQHLRDAVVAMSQARARGGASHQLFDAPMHHRMVARLRIDKDLRRALETDELEPFYQPLVWLGSGEIAGFESLVRWRHPTRGLVPPSEFIGVAEEAGLMPALFRRLLPQVLEQTRRWQQAGHPSLLMNINLSPRQIAEPGLVELLAEQLPRYGLAPYSLGVEITENLLIEDDDAAVAVLHRIKDMKVRVLLDDFGVGYSALSCLHRFPIDGLKVDRSFLARLGPGEEGGAEIVRAIVNLAAGLSKSTTAEGIETPEQLRFVRALGCELGQGFYFGRPMPAHEASAVLAEGLGSSVSALLPGAHPPRHSHARGRVLLVDTDEPRRRLLRLTLEQQGYEVLLAAHAREGLAVAAEQQPEVIVVPLCEADLDGVRLCHQLHACPETGEIPVLLATTSPEHDPAAVRALEAGGRDVVDLQAPTPVLCARLDTQITLGRAQARLRRVAMTDELTGVLSRRFLFGALRRTVQLLDRPSSQGRGPSLQGRGLAGVAVLLADVDGLRRVNEREGQQAGDRMLARIAHTIEGSSRDTDLVARFGGEEFVVVLPDVDEAGAVHVAERIRRNVQEQCRSTVSIGGAFVERVPIAHRSDGARLDAAIEALIRDANEALAQAKHEGRNRVVLRCPSLDEPPSAPAPPIHAQAPK